MKNKACSLPQEDQRSLYKRYLFWLYKTTKDECDKIDRKFTQLDMDKKIQDILFRKIGSLKGDIKDAITPLVNDWKEYVLSKESDALTLKFSSSGQLDSKYVFLRMKLEAVTQVVINVFGRRTLKEFKKIYEEAAMEGITRDHSGRR